MDIRGWKTLLDRYFSQEVTLRQEEKYKALDIWQEKVRRILEKVSAKDNRFSFPEPIYSGSYYERTKVKEPNEFDLMLEIERLIVRQEPYDTSEDNLSTDPPLGYTTLIMNGEQVDWRRDGCIPRNGNHLSSTQVKSVFARYVNEAIRELGFAGIQALSSGPAVTLKITSKHGTTYSIDLTLAIKNKSWPDIAAEWKSRSRRGGWPTQNLIDEIVQEGCHLVAKRPRQEFTYASAFFWRYSFSAAEKKLALKGGHGKPGTCSKKVLRILKSLREKYQMSPLTSYHLKTIMFYEREENPEPSQWMEDHLATRFLSALDRLLRCLGEKRCPHYFIRNVNLFDSRFDSCYSTLIAKITDIKRNPQNYFSCP